MDSQKNRLAACWQHQDCNSCIHERHYSCGWCPSTDSCVPADTLLDPLRNADICPTRSDRFELRTRALGCGCSTTTLLSVIVTVVATVAALFVLYGLVRLVRAFVRTFATGAWQGWEIEVRDDGRREEKPWSRTGVRWRVFAWTGKLGLRGKGSEQEEVTERSRLLG